MTFGTHTIDRFRAVDGRIGSCRAAAHKRALERGVYYTCSLRGGDARDR